MTLNLKKLCCIILAVSIYSCQDPVPRKKSVSDGTINESPSRGKKQKEFTEVEYYSKQLQEYTFNKYPKEECKVKALAKVPDLSQLKELPADVLRRIKADYQENNPNLNCKFKIVSWGCGSPCQMVAIFDSETGKLIKTLVTAFGVDYRLQSQLIIVDPPLETPIDTNYRQTIGEPVFWKLSGGRLEKLN